MQTDRFYGLLGLAARGRNVVSGEGASAERIKNKSAKLVMVACDASENTKKKFRNSCDFYSVPYTEFGDRYSLGRAIGKGFAVVLAVTNEGLADKLCEHLQSSDNNE